MLFLSPQDFYFSIWNPQSTLSSNDIGKMIPCVCTYSLIWPGKTVAVIERLFNLWCLWSQDCTLFTVKFGLLFYAPSTKRPYNPW